jgi:hypothetical protein
MSVNPTTLTPTTALSKRETAARNAEAYRVLAYQRGYNDRMAGRPKFCCIPHAANATPIEAGAYLQGWVHGGKHSQVIT